MNIYEVEQRQQFYSTGTEIINTHIQPNDRVLEVGPGAEYGEDNSVLPMDIGGVFGIGHRLAQAAGNLTVLGLSQKDKLEYEGGYNNMPLLQATIQDISANIPNVLSAITFIESPILNYQPSEDQKYDVVWDHLTFFEWLVPSSNDRTRVTSKIVAASEHYLDLVDENGKIILFFRYSPVVSEIKNAFKGIAATYDYTVTIEESTLLTEAYTEPGELAPYLRTNYQEFKDTARNGSLFPTYEARKVLVIQKMPNEL